MGVIFVMSSRAGSNGNSGGLLDHVLAWASPTFYNTLSPYQLECLNHGFRKTCHITEYAILAFLVVRAIRFGRPRFPLWALPAAFFACVLYAGTDELHQHFVPGRTASVDDVMIDSSGVAIAVSILAAHAACGALDRYARRRMGIAVNGTAADTAGDEVLPFNKDSGVAAHEPIGSR